jgi:hypothetical protein
MSVLTISGLIKILQRYPDQDARIYLEIPGGTAWYLEPGHIQKDEFGEVIIAAGDINGPYSLEEKQMTMPMRTRVFPEVAKKVREFFEKNFPNLPDLDEKVEIVTEIVTDHEDLS